MPDFSIRPYEYNEDDAAKLAVMWNESDDQWPGTFTDGVPFTMERVRDWMNRERGLANWVVEDPGCERIVGYGSLWEEYDRAKTCYVALLNVHPAYQGKSLARHMLTQMVDKAVELNYNLMTIETWPGNLKSVPLYKKVGFFWMPDTAVFMENYVPMIRQLPVARRFFREHDWYTTFDRELSQVEDDHRHGNMKVFRYHWANDNSNLSVTVDREAETVTGIETESFSAYAEMVEIEPAHSLRYPIHWRVTNKQNRPVNVSILAQGEPGIELTHRQAFVLKPNEEKIISSHLKIDPDIRPVKKNRPAPKVNTTLVVGSDLIELGTGLRPRPAITISTEPSPPVLLPDRRQTIQVQLQNHLDRPLEGYITLAPEAGLETDWEEGRRRFILDEMGFGRLPLTITPNKTAPLRLRASFVVDEDEIQTRSQQVPLLVLPPGGVAAHHISDPTGLQIDMSRTQDETIIAENFFCRLVGRCEGGKCTVWSKSQQAKLMDIAEVLGPPFIPSELRHKPYQIKLEQADGRANLIFTAHSSNFPGLIVRKEVTLTASPLITVRYQLINESQQRYQARLNPRPQFNQMVKATLTLPRADRLLSEPAELFCRSFGDVPKEPEKMAERWLAWQVDDMVAGVTWDASVEENEWHWNSIVLTWPEIELAPGATVDLPELTFYAGPGDWSQVRQSWARLNGKSLRELEQLSDPGREVEFGFVPAPLLIAHGQIETTLQVINRRHLPLDGKLTVEMPAGWQISSGEHQLETLTVEQAQETKVQITAPEGTAGAHSGSLKLHTNRFDMEQPFSIIRLGDEQRPVAVEQKEEVFQISNGRSIWQVAPDYCAELVSWAENGQETVNHLYSPYPEADGSVLNWLKPWYGGVHPFLFPPHQQDGWPGKLYQEAFKAQVCQRVDGQGISWHGIRLQSELQHKQFLGIWAELEYLTIGESNLLKVIYRLSNDTAIYRWMEAGLFAFCQVDGRYQNTELHAEKLHLKRTPTMEWPVAGRWAAASNPDTGRALVMVSGTAGAPVSFSDWGMDGGHLLCNQRVQVSPHHNHEIVVYLALTESVTEAKRYAALAK